jgi:hypothetical protein
VDRPQHGPSEYGHEAAPEGQETVPVESKAGLGCLLGGSAGLFFVVLFVPIFLGLVWLAFAFLTGEDLGRGGIPPASTILPLPEGLTVISEREGCEGGSTLVCERVITATTRDLGGSSIRDDVVGHYLDRGCDLAETERRVWSHGPCDYDSHCLVIDARLLDTSGTIEFRAWQPSSF